MIRTRLALVALALAGCGGGDGPAASIAFEHVTLIDGTDAGARPNMTVAIDGDRIVAVGPSGKVKLGSVETRVDATGMYLIPGLWDSHVHVGGYKERALPLFLANGVTTIREVGGDLAETGYLRQEVRFGRMLGPDVLISGPVLDAPQVVALVPVGRAAVPTAESGRKMVDSLASLGIDQIKVHSLTPRAAYFAILAEAKKRGIPVVGHVPDSVTIEEAIDSGQRSIEHDFGIAFASSARGAELRARFLAAESKYIASAGKRFKVLLPFEMRLAWADSAEAAFDFPTASGFAKKAAAAEVWFDPTLVVLHYMFLVNEPGAWDLPELRFAPRAVKDNLDGPGPSPSPKAADIELGRARWAAEVKLFRELVREKVRFLAGTDTDVMPLVPGFSLHRELGLLVEIGLTPLEAIQAATRNPAEAARKEDRGTVEVGRRADLVLLSADPLADIGNLKSVMTVVANGRLLERATLDRMLQDAENYAAQR